MFFFTPKGIQVWLENDYPRDAVAGVSVLVTAAALSLIAVVVMLLAIMISSYNSEHGFIRSHLGAYFVSLILAELVQATGSILSARWIFLHKVYLGPYCVTQAALKNAGNVSTALWSMIIAFHTFTLVFLRMRVPPWLFYTTLGVTWSIVGFIVILGPAALQNNADGPFWGIAGYWCWIAQGYTVERFTMEYLFMFVTAGISIVLYALIFLRMRGNIEGTGFRLIFRRASSPWQGDTGLSDPQIARVGKTMLLYPVAYVILILPIAACRWSEVFGNTVPFAVTIFADTVFLLSGLVNAILYSTTRSVVPVTTLVPSNKTNNAANESFESGKSDEKYSMEKGEMDEEDVLEHVPPASPGPVQPLPSRPIEAVRKSSTNDAQRAPSPASVERARSLASDHAASQASLVPSRPSSRQTGSDSDWI